MASWFVQETCRDIVLLSTGMKRDRNADQRIVELNVLSLGMPLRENRERFWPPEFLRDFIDELIRQLGRDEELGADVERGHILGNAGIRPGLEVAAREERVFLYQAVGLGPVDGQKRDAMGGREFAEPRRWCASDEEDCVYLVLGEAFKRDRRLHILRLGIRLGDAIGTEHKPRLDERSGTRLVER